MTTQVGLLNYKQTYLGTALLDLPTADTLELFDYETKVLDDEPEVPPSRR